MNDTEDNPPPPRATAAPPPRVPAGAEAGGARPRRRLYRSRSDRKVAGVAGGLGDYFDVDPVLFRLGFVLLGLMGGSGILAYAVAWIILPEGDSTRASEPDAPGRARSGDGVSATRIIGGGLLLALGLAAFVDLPRFGFIFPWSWPVILITAGLAVLLWNQRRDPGPDHAPAAGPGPDPGPDPGSDSPADGGEPDGGPGPAALELGTPPGTALLPAGPAEADRPRADGPPGDGPPGGGPPAEGPPGDGAAGRGPPVESSGAVGHPLRKASATVGTLGAVFLYWGVLALGHVADWWTAGPVAVLGGALALCGAGLMAGAWLGRGLLLIPVAAVLAVLLGFFAWIDLPLEGGFGSEEHRFSALSEVAPAYELTAGQIVLDLTGIDIDSDLALDASVGMGELVVEVPDSVDLMLDARAGMGEVVLTDATGREYRRGGIDTELRRTLRPDGSGGDEVHLDAEVGIGKIEVRQVQVRDASPPAAASASATGTWGRPRAPATASLVTAPPTVLKPPARSLSTAAAAPTPWEASSTR